jgi:flagella basal body P-ring formation protein FlgA
MRILLLAAALASLGASSFSGPAFAGQPVSLKSQVVASGRVTLGDLFDGAGKASGVVVGPTVSQGGSVVLNASVVQRAAMNAGLTWANEDGLRNVIVRSGEASGPAPAAASSAAAKVEVLTYNRSLEAGEIVQPEDLSWTKLAAAPAGAPRDADALIGKAARRPLRSGAAASTRDVTNPLVVKRDDMVEVVFAMDGVNLSLQAKAMGAAAVGDTVSLMNLSSKKVIQAVVAAPGKAVVGPEADALRAQSSSSQFASR